MTILYELEDPAVLTGYVRELPDPQQVFLNRYLPDELVDDIEALIDQLDQTNRAASFRAFDAETPIGQRDTLTRKRVKLPPIGQKTVLTEYERLQLARLEGADTGRLVNRLYDDVEINARATRLRMELARGDLLADGIVTMTENGLEGLTANFGLPGTHSVSPSGADWDDHANSTPFDDIDGWLDTYDNDGPAGVISISRTTRSHLLQNESLRGLAALAGIVPSSLTIEQLNSLAEARGFPRFEVRPSARIEHLGQNQRPIPEEAVLILPDEPRDLGYTAWGITAEALELAEAQRLMLEDAPGLVAVPMKTEEPVQVWTKVGAVGMPVLANPRRLMVATVFTP